LHLGRGHRLSSIRMTLKPPVIPRSRKNQTSKIADPLDIAARYFAYKLYVPGKTMTESRYPVSTLGEAAATVGRAVELGWVTLRDVGQGRTRERYAALTDEGRQVARKALR
jgi:hypothetical protein